MPGCGRAGEGRARQTLAWGAVRCKGRKACSDCARGVWTNTEKVSLLTGQGSPGRWTRCINEVGSSRRAAKTSDVIRKALS